MVNVKKKSGKLEPFDSNKVLNAIQLSAKRALKVLSDEDKKGVLTFITDYIDDHKLEVVDVPTMHNLVERALDINELHSVAQSYRYYRNWKSEYAKMMHDVFEEVDKIETEGNGHENANTSESLVTTKRCMKANVLNTVRYKTFFLTPTEREHMTDGYYYIHDRSARLDTYNCCLFDIKATIDGGFDFEGTHYNEPHGLDAAMSLLGDVISMTASNQYGGWSARIDDFLAKYLEMTYDKLVDKYTKKYQRAKSQMNDEELADLVHEDAMTDIEEILRQKFQALEHQLNTVATARGDFPFTTFAIGLGTKWSERLITEWCLRVRMEGQGAPGHKKPMVFPKLVFLYDEKIHGEGGVNNDLFELALQCSSKCMYPDYLSLTGDGYVPDMYKKYGEVVFPMG